jgi:hypothetical protein
MSGNDDAVSDDDDLGCGLSESDVFHQDYLALLRHVHGPITPEELGEAEVMAAEAYRRWHAAL